jgi:hypothetical protein
MTAVATSKGLAGFHLTLGCGAWVPACFVFAGE